MVKKSALWLYVLKGCFVFFFFLQTGTFSSIIHRRVHRGNPVRLKPRPSLLCYVWLAQMSESNKPLGVLLSLSLGFLTVGHFHSRPQALMVFFSGVQRLLVCCLFLLFFLILFVASHVDDIHQIFIIISFFTQIENPIITAVVWTSMICKFWVIQ